MRLSESPASSDAVLAAHQVLRHQRPVRPRQHVIVQRVHLAERRAHLARLQLQAGGQRGERDVALFQIDAVLAEGDEEIGARVRIDNLLKPTSLSCISSDGVGRFAPYPAAPRKSPITLMSGFSAFADAAARAAQRDRLLRGRSGSLCPGGGAGDGAGAGVDGWAVIAAVSAACWPFIACNSASSDLMRSSIAFIRASSSAVSCAPSFAAIAHARTTTAAGEKRTITYSPVRL